ncbi:MAG TPA: FAD-binding oxidoreductase [Parasegetibacter sp.]
MAEPWREGKIIRIEEVNSNTRRFWIEVPELEKFVFKPGQFVTLDLPIHEQKNKRWRSYSIASRPDDTNVFELVIVLLEGGLGTTYLFNEVSVGSSLLLRGPQGIFVLPDEIEKDLFLICTGTGIAPFRSMVQHVYYHNIPHKSIYLIFGCRTLGDCLYGQEMRELEQKLADFWYIPTFSREDRSQEFIRKGYVHTVYEEIIRNNRPDADFYLCGWKNMIDEAKARLLNLGFDRKSIHFELYG